MRKFLGLTLGATVLMMGYVDGTDYLKQAQPGTAPKRPGDSLANLARKQKEIKTDESVKMQDYSTLTTPLTQKSKETTQGSPNTILPQIGAQQQSDSGSAGEPVREPVDTRSFYDYCYGIVLLLNNHPTPKATAAERQAYLKDARKAVSAWVARACALAKKNEEIKDTEELSLFVRGVSLYLQDEGSLKTADTLALPAATTLLGYLRKLAGEDIWTSVEAQTRITLKRERQELSDEQRKQLSEALARLADELDGEDDDF